MRRKLLSAIFIFILIFSNMMPSLAFANDLKPALESDEIKEDSENLDRLEKVQIKEESSNQELIDEEVTEQTTDQDNQKEAVRQASAQEKKESSDEEKKDKKESSKEESIDKQAKESVTQEQVKEAKPSSKLKRQEEKDTKEVPREDTKQEKAQKKEKETPQASSTEIGANLLLDDFEQGIGSWTVSSARANAVQVSISDEFARFGKHSLQLDYDFLNQPGTSGVYANRSEAIEIPGHPKKMSMWVYGDGEKHWLRQILYDANGESFNIDYTPSYPEGVTWKGWKYLEARIPDHWKPPFKIGNQAIRYMATNEKAKGKATIYIDDLRAIYEDVEEDTTNPTISDFSPSSEQLVYSNQPEISVRVTDEDSGMDYSKTEMKVDGKSVSPTIDEDKGMITYRPTKPLAEGLHSVWVNVADQAGNHSFTDWSFTVETDGPVIHWDVDEAIYAGSTFTANLSLKHGEKLAGTTFTIHYDADKLQLEDSDSRQEGIQLALSKKLQSTLSHYNVDAERGIIELAFAELEDVSFDEEETIVSLPFSLGLDASGDFEISLTDGEYFYVDAPTEAVPFFIAPFKGHISQPLTLELTGLSEGTPTTMKVVDKDGKPVQDASISILGGQKLIKVTKPTSIYKGGSGLAGEPYEDLEVGDFFPVAKSPYAGFDFYRIYMPNGQQRYYHLPKEDVEEVDWGALFGKTNDKGIIETDQLTFSRIGLKLQATKGQLVSQVESIKISPQLAKERPKHVTLTWTDDPKTSQHFSWKTNTFTEGSVVEMTPSDEKGAAPLVFKGSHSLFGDHTGEMNLHKVLATGLQPGTTYQYRVGDGTEDGWSDYHSFTTESATNDPFRFMFVADTQAYDQPGFKLFTDLFQLGLDKFPDTKFAVHAGDIVENGDKLTEWEYFADASQGLADQMPLMMVLGNHDVYGEGANFFKNMYDYPQNGPTGKEGFVYSFDYNNARFIMLNSEFGIQDMKEQHAWIQEEVESAGDKWTVVMFHRSPYKSNPKRGDDATMNMLAPVIEDLDVDLVLTGHDHAYMRSHFMKNGEVQEDGNGTLYVIGGSAGPKFYPGGEADYMNVMYAEEKQVFTSLLVDKDKITIEAYTHDDELVDSYVLKKRDKAPAVDKTALQALVAAVTAEDLLGENYTKESWNAFSKTFEEGKRVLEDTEKTQEEIDAATTKLKDAYDALAVKEEEQPTDPNAPEQDEDASKPGQGDDDASKPGQDDDNASQPGQGDDDETQPGQDDDNASQPGQGDDDASKPGQGDADASKPGQDDDDTSKPDQGDDDASKPGQDDDNASQPGQDDDDASQPGQGDDDASKPGQGDKDGVNSEEDEGAVTDVVAGNDSSDDTGQEATEPKQDEKDREHPLPNTATSIYSMIFLGVILLLLGVIGFAVYRRRLHME